MRRLYYVYAFPVFFLSVTLSAQKTKIITVRKNSELIYFFQKDVKSDTIKNYSLFYLLVPDSLKEVISIQSHNAQVIAGANDSLVSVNYIRGLKYESIYSSKSGTNNSQGKKQKKELEFTMMVNGTSDEPDNEVLIRIVNRKDERIILEHRYYIRR